MDRIIKFRQKIHSGGFHYWGYIGNTVAGPMDNNIAGDSEQFIGKKDCNKKEIYEGDILIMNPLDDEWHDQVEWRSDQLCFELRKYRDPSTDIALLDAIKNYGDNCSYVVGNIHENAELLL